MLIQFKKLTKPTSEIAQAFNRWENDLSLTPFLRPNKNQEDVEEQQIINNISIRGQAQFGVISVGFTHSYGKPKVEKTLIDKVYSLSIKHLGY